MEWWIVINRFFDLATPFVALDMCPFLDNPPEWAFPITIPT